MTLLCCEKRTNLKVNIAIHFHINKGRTIRNDKWVEGHAFTSLLTDPRTMSEVKCAVIGVTAKVNLYNELLALE